MDDLRSNIERPIAFDGIMRVRTSTGILSIHTIFPSNICKVLFRNWCVNLLIILLISK